MKKLLLICMLAGIGLQAFSFSPGATKATKIPYTFSENLNAMTIQKFLELTPKKYQEITGKRMTLKQKIAFAVLKVKLKKQLADDKPAPRTTDLGLLSLIFGGATWFVLLIPNLAVASIGFAVVAIILGILGLGRKKGDAKSIIGLVLGGLFIVLLALVIAAFASGGWF